jgi:hypothetical protein
MNAKKPTKKEQEQIAKERQDETARQRFAIETALDFELRSVACRVLMLSKGATSDLFAGRAKQAFLQAEYEATRLLPKGNA